LKALPRLSHPGGVDGDGHVLEPPDLWERYLEPPLRSRALRVRKDDRGLEYVEIDGRPSKLVRNGMPAGLGLMDRVGGIVYPREAKTGLGYVDLAPLGAIGKTLSGATASSGAPGLNRSAFLTISSTTDILK